MILFKCHRRMSGKIIGENRVEMRKIRYFPLNVFQNSNEIKPSIIILYETSLWNFPSNPFFYLTPTYYNIQILSTKFGNSCCLALIPLKKRPIKVSKFISRQKPTRNLVQVIDIVLPSRPAVCSRNQHPNNVVYSFMAFISVIISLRDVCLTLSFAAVSVERMKFLDSVVWCAIKVFIGIIGNGSISFVARYNLNGCQVNAWEQIQAMKI